LGDVEKFATIVPKRVNLRGDIEKQIKISVKIIPEEKYPFEIVEAKAKNGKFIKYKLEEVTSLKGTEYLLNVENLKREKGRYFDTIYLKTTSKIRPEIKISVYGNITDKKQSSIKKVQEIPPRQKNIDIRKKEDQNKQDNNRNNKEGDSLRIE